MGDAADDLREQEERIEEDIIRHTNGTCNPDDCMLCQEPFPIKDFMRGGDSDK